MTNESCSKDVIDHGDQASHRSSSSIHQELVESIVTSYSDPEDTCATTNSIDRKDWADGDSVDPSDGSKQITEDESNKKISNDPDRHNSDQTLTKELPSSSSNTAVMAQLHRFYVSEVKSVRFGQLEDSTSTIIMIISSFILVNAALMLWGTAIHKPIWFHFIQSSQFVAIFLLLGWIIAFNVISLTIHYQFERDDVLVADDFYIAAQEDGTANSPTHAMQQPCVVQMPDSQIVLAVPSKRANSVAVSSKV